MPVAEILLSLLTIIFSKSILLLLFYRSGCEDENELLCWNWLIGELVCPTWHGFSRSVEEILMFGCDCQKLLYSDELSLSLKILFIFIAKSDADIYLFIYFLDIPCCDFGLFFATL